ncbi:hypothetical protein [Halorarius halobius]|uniref:hypothetical protein n=1 Tax=Halorarius halobius TaxID=2962671 RepID=UPI0020CBDEEA|nr:hypothetical protein [Halorarius halobius]
MTIPRPDSTWLVVLLLVATGVPVAADPASPAAADGESPESEPSASPVGITRPNGSYELGTRTTLGGTAPADAGAVALYVRADGDWHLLDTDEDGRRSDDDAVAVGPDGTWRREGVVLTNASRVVAGPGRYQLGAVVRGAVCTPNGTLRPQLPADALGDGHDSVAVSLDVTAPAESESPVFRDIGGQVAIEDGEVTVAGLAPGADEVLAVAVDRRGEFASDLVSVDRDGTFETDLALAAPDGGPLSRGAVVGVVLSAGRDGRVGNGIIREEFGADLASLERHLGERRAAVELSQAQLLDILFAESVEEAGSDDLSVVDTFALADARTTIEAVVPAGAINRTGVRSVPVGETMVVRGQTNRKPGDNSVFVDLVDAETSGVASLATAGEWGQSGVWRARLSTDGLEPGSYLLQASDGDDGDVVRVDLVAATGNRSAG